MESIKQRGMEKGRRNFVHLSSTEQTAVAVGARHGKPVVLKISTRQMALDGHRFYLSENGVWLTRYVPFEYVTSVLDE